MSIVDVPDSGEYEAVIDIGCTAAPIETRQRGKLDLLGIVHSHHHLGLVRLAVDHLCERVRGLQRKAVREALGELDETAVIDGIGAAVEDADSSKGAIGPGWSSSSWILQETDGCAIQGPLYQHRR